MGETFTAKRVITHPYFAMVCILALFFVLPRYGAMAVMISCASLLTAYVSVSPEQFRSRNGSMTLATCLVTAMWVAAAFITALTLMGKVH